ncbi:MAG: tetratricopeptide repeat protein, partial [Verrucomicrobia bacterium]|nr:tetratricopeptide repeat protein [Verrucomicrobiota bacterium]
MLATFKYSYVADHYQYVACIGPIALFAAGSNKAFGRLNEVRPYLKPLFCAILLFVLGSLTWLQTFMYSDLEALWRTTIDRNSSSHMAHTNLGLLLMHRGESEEGWMHLQKALELRPDLEIGHYNIGFQLAKQGQVDTAIPYYRKAIELSPNFFPAHIALGDAMVQKGRFRTAVAEYEFALKLQPTNAPLLFSFCWILGTSSDASIRNGAKAVEMGERAAR